MDQHTRMLTPKIQNESGNKDFSEGHMSSVKKTKKRRLRIISDYDEASRQEKSPSNPEFSPVTRERSTISGQEKSTYKTTRIITPTFIKSLRPEKSPSKPEESAVPKRRPRMPKAASNQEKSPTEPGHSPVARGRSTTSIEASSKPQHSRVTRERSKFSVYYLRPLNSSSVPEESSMKRKRPRESVEHFEPEECPSEPEQSPFKKRKTVIPTSKPEHARVTRGRSRISVYNLRPLNSSLVPEESCMKRKRPIETVEHFEPEECPSEHEQSPIKKGRTGIPSALDEKKCTTKVLPSRKEINNEGPLRINPSVTKRHADSSAKMSQKHAYQTLSNVQVESPGRTSPVKRKSSIATHDIIHQNHFGPEASVIESETSPTKITQVTGDQLNHSGQKNLSAKAKASKIKSAAPVDNNEVLSDLGENSVPIVKRKINRMALSGKNNRRPRSPPKRTISHTHDKKSKDANSNGNISEPANGLRRSSRFRVPPLDTWRNERLVFETLPSGEVKCSIDKGSEEDKFGLIKIARKAERRIQMEKKKVQTVENTPIVDTRTGETVHALLHRPFESLHWSMPPNEVERPPRYIAVKAFKSNSTSFGFVDISPLSTTYLLKGVIDAVRGMLIQPVANRDL
ncbi:CENP-C_C domain-containing protein [Trichonephila clavipes]|nr:CENP-C_C domain-containing protein [Trichonephila clavipes]